MDDSCDEVVVRFLIFFIFDKRFDFNNRRFMFLVFIIYVLLEGVGYCFRY